MSRREQNECENYNSLYYSCFVETLTEFCGFCGDIFSLVDSNLYDLN